MAVWPPLHPSGGQPFLLHKKKAGQKPLKPLVKLEQISILLA